MNNYFFIYPKDKDGKPTGHTICIYNHAGKNYIGEAICSKKDVFRKEIGRQLALDRAMIKAVVKTGHDINLAEKVKGPDKTVYADYQDDCDYDRYPGSDPKKRSIYRVFKTTKPGYRYDTVKNIVVKHSPKDKIVTPAWANLELVRLESDGNGLDVTVRDSETETRKFRLNYSQACDLKLALRKYHQHYRYGKHTRIK